MSDKNTDRLVILAGGQSRRMGRDKALIEIDGKRLINHMVDRFRRQEISIFLSARQDYGTGLHCIPDNPDAPAGPVGAIYTLSEYFLKQAPQVAGFYTIPVDAPHAPLNLMDKLNTPNGCAVAASNGQIQPVFAYWHCNIVSTVRHEHDSGNKTPSLRWLAKQSGAKVVDWEDDRVFTNINTPEDLDAINDRQ